MTTEIQVVILYGLDPEEFQPIVFAGLREELAVAKARTWLIENNFLGDEPDPVTMGELDACDTTEYLARWLDRYMATLTCRRDQTTVAGI